MQEQAANLAALVCRFRLHAHETGVPAAGYALAR
jgi:methyl-accepting chemotaxis protein